MNTEVEKLAPIAVIDSPPGAHIDDEINRCIELIGGHDDVRIQFSFNDTVVIIDHKDTLETVKARWHFQMQENARLWRESPEGIASALAQEDRANVAKAKTAALLHILPQVIAMDHSMILQWLVEYQDAGDHIAVDAKCDWVLKQFEDAGYKVHYGVGRAPEDFKTDKTLSARYVIGQMMDFMSKGFAGHQLVHKFAGDYFVLAGMAPPDLPKAIAAND